MLCAVNVVKVLKHKHVEWRVGYNGLHTRSAAKKQQEVVACRLRNKPAIESTNSVCYAMSASSYSFWMNTA